MEPQMGLEPTACCLEGSCSIRLSYWGIGRVRMELNHQDTAAQGRDSYTSAAHPSYGLGRRYQFRPITRYFTACREKCDDTFSRLSNG